MRSRTIFQWFLVIIVSFTLTGNLLYDVLHEENIFHSRTTDQELFDDDEFILRMMKNREIVIGIDDVNADYNRRHDNTWTGSERSNDESVRFLRGRNSTNVDEFALKDGQRVPYNRLADMIAANGIAKYSFMNSTRSTIDANTLRNLKYNAAARKEDHTNAGVQQKIVNPHPFRYIINTRRLCDNDGDDVFLLIYVHTAIDHHKRRNVIRQTWGDVTLYDVRVRVVFFLGSPPDITSKENRTEAQNLLHFEADEYGDIVQEDFIDTYHNLTYKGVAALKWIVNSCRRAKFVLKTDDDIFVNMFMLIRHLSRLRDREKITENTIVCMVYDHMKVMRTGKWKVSG